MVEENFKTLKDFLASTEIVKTFVNELKKKRLAEIIQLRQQPLN
jgi:hypothetical protein